MRPDVLPTLRGARVLLRPVRRRDLAVLRGWHNDAQIAFAAGRGDERPVSVAEQRRWYERYLRASGKTLSLQWVICTLASGRALGKIGLWKIRSRPREGDLGLFIAQAADRRRGYGREAVRLLGDFALAGLGFRRLRARVVSHNRASFVFFRQCGWKRAGPMRRALRQRGRLYGFRVFVREARASFGDASRLRRAP